MHGRNARFLANGWIDCEIDHPLWGWIPFTANPEDQGAGFDVAALHRALIAGGDVAPYVPRAVAEFLLSQSAD